MTVKIQEISQTEDKDQGIDLEDRAFRILNFLITQNTWLSAKEINNKFNYVHSTLWKALRFLQDEQLVTSCRSLSDTRVTLYRVSMDYHKKFDPESLRILSLEKTFVSN